MILIPPLEISSRIMTMIDESEDQLIIVSPYVNLTLWEKMKKCLKRAVSRKVNIVFVARKNATQDLSFILETGIKLVLIDNLHAKIYCSEKYAIVTSQNMVYFSDVNSIDIAYQTNSSVELDELRNFIDKNIIEIKPPQTKLPFKRISKLEESTKTGLSADELLLFWENFSAFFPKYHFKKASNYLFNEDVFTFADLMIDSNFVIKINKRRTDCEQLLLKIESLNFKLKHQFIAELFVSHNSYYYIYYKPISEINLEILVKDQISILNAILSSDLSGVVNPQPNLLWK